MLVARFVDSIDAARTVRLDLNDGGLWRLLESSRFDPPAAKRARVSTLLADGAHYPESAYDDRVLELRLLLQGSSGEEVAGQVQLLARELDRPDGNIFEYQPDGLTHPVFLRTRRLGLDVAHMPADVDRLDVEVNVPAEPFAFGLPVTLPAVTVSNDPAAASNGMFFDVSAVKGDVDADTSIKETGLEWFNSSVLFACRCHGTPANVPFVLQAEAMTLGTDTTLPGNDATASGAGSNYARISFATSTSLTSTRLSKFYWPATPSTDARGTYRVFMRVRRSNAVDEVSVRLRAGPDGTTVPAIKTIVTALTTGWQVLDFGLVQIPFGADPRWWGPSGVEVAAKGVAVEVNASRTSGTCTLDVDYLLWPPHDEMRLAVDAGNDAFGDGYVLDSANDVMWAWEDIGGQTVVHSSADLIPLGGLPTLRPGVTNRIYVLSDFRGQMLPSATVDLQVTYWPRYMHIRPATT